MLHNQSPSRSSLTSINFGYFYFKNLQEVIHILQSLTGTCFPVSPGPEICPDVEVLSAVCQLLSVCLWSQEDHWETDTSDSCVELIHNMQLGNFLSTKRMHQCHFKIFLYKETDFVFFLDNKNSLEFVQGDDALIGHISTWHHLHHTQTLLQILYWAQPLQTGILDVDALVELDFLHIFQTI